MNNCKQLHETVVRDIVDIITSAKDFDQIKWINNKNNTGSIAKRASNLVLVFPVMVSNSLNIQTAMIVSKAIERKCCSLLQILFSSMQITNADNLQDYIKQFHTNLDLKDHMDLDEFFGVMDSLVDEEAIIVDKDMYESIKEDMHNINFHLEEEFNPHSINDYKVVNNAFGESSIMLERAHTYQAMGDNKTISFSGNKVNLSGSTTNNYYAPSGGGGRNDDPLHPGMRDQNDYFAHQLLDNDIKKANELMPTTMIVNFISRDEGVNDVIRMSGVIGVKAKLYPVDSMDICNRMSSKVKDKNGLFNLVRASTREISFFKDLAFAIDKAKMDAMYMASDSNNAKMFKVLERRAAKNKFSRLIKKNDASPITSLVISQYEVDYLKQLNIDMEKSFNARSILEGYNLMDIVVADESMEIAKFLFDDGDGVYEAITFDALEKQANDSTYKKVVNLVSKINR
jgi:hypothetical protein